MSASKVIDSKNDTKNPPGAAPPKGSSSPPQMTPEMTANIEKFRHAIQLGMGQIVLATMSLPRYRNQTLADLNHLFVTPLLRDRVAIAKKTKPAEGAAPAEDSVVGIALWATVSEAVDAKIAEQIKANVFPGPARAGGLDERRHRLAARPHRRRQQAGDVGAGELPQARRREVGEDRAAGGAVDRPGGGGEVAGGPRRRRAQLRGCRRTFRSRRAGLERNGVNGENLAVVRAV